MLVDEQSEDYILLQQYHTLDVTKKSRLMGYLQALCQNENKENYDGREKDDSSPAQSDGGQC